MRQPSTNKNNLRARTSAAGMCSEGVGEEFTSVSVTASNGGGSSEANVSAVMWYSVNVWRALKRLTTEEMREAVKGADAVLEMNPPFGKVEADIPHFGICSYGRALAIVSVWLCANAKTDHVESRFLAAARQARWLA